MQQGPARAWRILGTNEESKPRAIMNWTDEADEEDRERGSLLLIGICDDRTRIGRGVDDGI